MASENRQEFDVTLGTFAHPRYELIATGEVYDGTEEVSRYYAASRAPFPDQRNEVHAVHHADDAVIVEFDLLGTTRARCVACRRRVASSGAGWWRCSCSQAIVSSASASTSTRRPSSASSGSSPI